MDQGIVDKIVTFLIPPDLDPSENNGAFSRDYDLVVKIELPLPHGQVKTSTDKKMELEASGIQAE